MSIFLRDPEAAAARRRLALPLLRLTLSILLLAILIWSIDGQDLVSRFATLHWPWVWAALALSLPQQLLHAGRWHFTAARLGAGLTYRRALADYYLASFVNQVLPGGIAGDAWRAWRHGRRLTGQQSGGLGIALRAVIYERTAGQVVLLAFVAAGFFLWPRLLGDAFVPPPVMLVLVLLCLTLCLWWMAGRQNPLGDRLRAFLTEARQALLASGALPRQIILSGLIVLSYLATYACGLAALGLTVTPAVVFGLLPLVLLAMSLPLSFAGWGLREASAAGLWALAGLPPAEGLAGSLLYGLIILAASLPGAGVLASGR